MSFLSKLNSNKASVAAGTADVTAKPASKVNPFAKNPFAKGNPFVTKKPAPVVPAPVTTKTDERDGRAPVEETQAETKVAAPIEETATEKLAKQFLSGEKKPTPIKGQEEVEEAEETAVEEASSEKKFEAEADTAVKAAAEDVAPAEETDAKPEEPAEEKAEEKPKKKVTRRRTTKKVDEKAEEAAQAKAEQTAAVPAKLEKKTDSQRVLQVAHFKPVDILGQKISYDEACQLVLTQFNDTNAWQQYEDDVLAQLDSKELRIEADMNPGTLKVVECALDALATDLLRNYIKTKQLNELLTNKDFGTAYALMAEYSDGKNTIDRQQSGFRALASTDIGGTKVNMLAMIATTRMHLVFLQAVMDRIKSKQNMCITMSSAIKVENSMSMLGAQG